MTGNLPSGVFWAVSTRDGAAQERDGEAFYAYRLLPESVPTGDPLYEVQFEDGVWMLARLSDLELG